MSGPLLPTPWMYGRRRLTRVELAIYAVIVAALIAGFSSYALQYMEVAEKTAMDSTLSNVALAINVRYASRLMAGERDDASWTRQNPFELAKAFPPNYRGAGGEDLDGADRPAWFFDIERAEIVYLPRLHRFLTTPTDNVLRFALQRSRGGAGYVLVPTSKYQWAVYSERN